VLLWLWFVLLNAPWWTGSSSSASIWQNTALRHIEYWNLVTVATGVWLTQPKVVYKLDYLCIFALTPVLQQTFRLRFCFGMIFLFYTLNQSLSTLIITRLTHHVPFPSRPHWRRTHIVPYCVFICVPIVSLSPVSTSLSWLYIIHCTWLSNSLYVVPYLRVRDQVSPTYKTTVYSLLVYARLWVFVRQLLLN
jgi:hypothetical protein